MNETILALEKYIQPGKRVHLVGIGGVSMRPLGLVLQGMGLMVSGSDMNASVSTDELIAKGYLLELRGFFPKYLFSNDSLFQANQHFPHDTYRGMLRGRAHSPSLFRFLSKSCLFQ